MHIIRKSGHAWNQRMQNQRFGKIHRPCENQRVDFAEQFLNLCHRQGGPIAYLSDGQLKGIEVVLGPRLVWYCSVQYDQIHDEFRSFGSLLILELHIDHG